MAIDPGEDIVASDFVSASAGAGDEGKVPKLNAIGKLDNSFNGEPDPIVRLYTSNDTWSKPAGLKYIEVETQAGGGGAGSSGPSTNDAAAGAGAGGYARKLIPAASLGANETVTVAAAGVGGISGNGTNGGNSSFGSHLSANGGSLSTRASSTPGDGGTATGGDINIPGQDGGLKASAISGFGGSSMLGFGGRQVSGAAQGKVGKGYGSGGSGGSNSGGEQNGGAGTQGIVIVIEHYL